MGEIRELDPCRGDIGGGGGGQGWFPLGDVGEASLLVRGLVIYYYW